MLKTDMIRKMFSFAIALSLGLGVPYISYALPTGEQVVSGDASFQQTDPNTLAVTTSDKAIINYDSFNIAQSETVRFIQPSSSSVVLNRVVGVDPSQLYGTLLANGQVFLVNPNGVFFGPNSRIDSGSFVASTLDISNEDLISGNYRFAIKDGEDPSYIVNKGDIKAAPGGYVALISPLVSNEGSISAPSGKVLVAGTDRLVVNFDGAGLINFAIPPSSASAGTVAMPQEHATDLIRSVVNTPELVEAAGIVEEDGVVRLVGAGGLALNSGSISVDAVSGSNAGSVVIDSTLATVLAPESRISANGAGENSKGGDIRVLSDMQNGLSAVLTGARLEARGSEVSGDGGFIELSANEFYLSDNTFISASASNGLPGVFLLDPTDITIQDAAGNIDPGVGGVFTPTGDTNTISDDAIEAFLNTGTSVQINTSSAFAAPGGGDITQNANAQINKTAGGAATITLTADDAITLNGGIVSTVGALGVSLVATGAVDINSAITTNGGAFSSSGTTFDNTGAAINTGGGILTIDHSGAVTIGAAIGGASAVGITEITGSVIQLGAGITSNEANINFNSPVSLTADVTVSTGAAGAGDITFDSTIDGGQALILQAGTGDVGVSGAIGATTALTGLTITGDDISLADIGDAAGAGVTGATLVTAAAAGGTITFTGTIYNANAQTYNPGAATNPITYSRASISFTSSDDNISFGGTLNPSAAGRDLSINTGTGSITFTGAVGNILALGAITITNAGDVTASSTITAASLTQSAGTGTTTFNGLVSTTGNASVTTGAITFAGAGSINANSGAGDVTLAAGTGGITSGTAAADVIAANLYMSAVTGIGASGNALSTQVSNVQASNSDSGDIRIDNTGNVNVFSSGITNSRGSVYLTSTSDITLISPVTAFSIVLTAQGSIKDDEDQNSDDVISTKDSRLTAASGTIGSANPIEVRVGGGLYVGAGGASEAGISAALKGTSGDGMVHLLFACPGIVIFNGMIFNAGSQMMQGLAQLNPYIANTLPYYMAMTLFGVDTDLTKPKRLIINKVAMN